jgi:type I restriction enzyme S subunit
MRDGWKEISLEDLEIQKVIKLGRGDVISKKDMEADPGPNPVYSSAENKNGMIGKYAKYMFDEELITWSVDGGGHIFHRPKHKFSVTNIGGWLRILDSKAFSYQFLTYALQRLHKQHHFDWQHKAHPSVIRKLYTRIPLPPLPEQKRIVDLISSVDSYIEALQQQLESAKRSRNAVLHELLTTRGDDWVETTLGEAAEVIMGRQLSPSKKLGTRPRPYIRAANIGSWGINLEDIYEMDFTEIEEERFACQVGDTILVEGGNEKSVGCPALITEKESGLCIQNTVIRCRSRNSKVLDPNFQYHLLRFMFWRGDFAQLCAGTTIMHLGQKRAEVVPVSIPPLGEQLNIVDTISKFDSAVTYSEETLRSAKSLRSGLLSDLLSGEHLIPSSYDKVIGDA